MSDYTEVTDLWRDYEHGVDYLNTTGLRKKLPQYVKFYEGEQWAPPTKLTKNMPRPVINIIKMICRSKKAAILSTPVKIVYEAETDGVDVEQFNRFSDYIQKEMGQVALDSDAISDGVKKGCYFYHYYWDSEARGKDGLKMGALRCEIIDALDIIFADPPYAISVELFQKLLRDKNFCSFNADSTLCWEVPDSPGAVGNFIDSPGVDKLQFRKFGGTIFAFGKIKII